MTREHAPSSFHMWKTTLCRHDLTTYLLSHYVEIIRKIQRKFAQLKIILFNRDHVNSFVQDFSHIFHFVFLTRDHYQQVQFWRLNAYDVTDESTTAMSRPRRKSNNNSIYFRVLILTEITRRKNWLDYITREYYSSIMFEIEIQEKYKTNYFNSN